MEYPLYLNHPQKILHLILKNLNIPLAFLVEINHCMVEKLQTCFDRTELFHPNTLRKY